MSSRSRTTGLLLPVVCAAVALAACFDRVAAPPPQLAPAPRHDFMGDANWGQNNSAQSGSWDGDVIDSVRGGFPNPPQPLGPIIYPTFIRVSVSGLVRQVPRAFPGQNIVRNA